MKRDVSVEAKKAQFMVEKAMGDITRATRKVLMDYVSRMYVTSFAKVIVYLGLESEDAIDLLDNMDYDTRRQVEAFATSYQKSDAQVISEVEHIVTSSGMNFTDDYKIIKDNIILSGKAFPEDAVHNFQNETPIFQKKIEDCIFSDFQYLDDRTIQKVLREAGVQELAKALKGASTFSATCPSVRLQCLKKTWNGWALYTHRMLMLLRLTLSKLFSDSQITEIFCLP